MATVTIELTKQQQEALNRGESITITPSTTNTVSRPEKDYSNLEYPSSNTFFIGYQEVGENYNGSDYKYKKAGVFRKYRKNAEIALGLKTDLLRLGALVEVVQEELQDTWEADWDDDGTEKYYIVYDETSKYFDYGIQYDENIVGVLFMSKQVAERVVKILNRQPEILRTV